MIWASVQDAGDQITTPDPDGGYVSVAYDEMTVAGATSVLKDSRISGDDQSTRLAISRISSSSFATWSFSASSSWRLGLLEDMSVKELPLEAVGLEGRLVELNGI